MSNGYEPEIDLKDMFFFILYRWRSVLLTAVIFCVLACGYKTAGDLIDANAEGNSGKPKAVREYEIAIADYELAKTTYEQNMENYQQRLEQQTAYLKESVLMQTDPYNAPSASADIFVKLDSAEWKDLPSNTSFDPTDSLLSIYVSNFHSNINWAPIEALTGKDALYLKELIGISADYNSNTFTVSVRHSDSGIAQQLLNIIVEQVMDRYRNMDAGINKHTISIVNTTLTYTIDDTLADTQKGNMDAISFYEQAIIDCRSGLEQLEEPNPPSGLKKYLVLGFAAGGLLAAALYAAEYILDGRIHEKTEIKDRYGCWLLGVMPHTEKPRHFSFVDRLLRKLEGTNRQPSEADAGRLIAAGIMAMAGEHKKLLVIGTTDFDRIQKFTSLISPMLKDITMTAAADINFMPDAVMNVTQCDAVVLAEEQHISTREGIQRENEFITALGKSIIGYVLL